MLPALSFLTGFATIFLVFMEFSTPKGTRDYTSAQMEVREALLDRIRAVFRLYGFRPLDTPAIETLATLQKKGGDEIEGQIFQIKDGDIGLRFDLTVPLARVCGQNQFVLPYKRYAIAKVWRREEPQKGRLREFVQTDIDIVGSASPRCEAELLACASQCLSELGFSGFVIRLNSRQVLESYFDKSGIAKESRRAIMRTLDKIGKLQPEKISALLEEILSDKAKAKELLEFIAIKGNKPVMEKAKKLGLEGAENLAQIVEQCTAFGVKPLLDMSLVRGLDYYTGAVFEVSASDAIGSVAGGGRYDNLIGNYGTPQPAVGISLGFERLFALIESGQFKAPDSLLGKKPQAFVACTDDKFYAYSLECAKAMRGAGVCCSTDLMARKFSKQMDFAIKQGFSYLAIVGEQEEKAKSVTIKNLKTGKQEVVPLAKISKYFEA